MAYQWQPLDKSRQEIRVLYLQPGVGDAPLNGQLRHVFLDDSDKPRYETISYAWGDTALVESCLVDGESIPIPASAGSALRCMRLPTHTLRFWIDCICIDQNNDLEKSRQVAMMADIFHNSSMTLAHLGDDDGNMVERAFNGCVVICRSWMESNKGKQMPDGIRMPIEKYEIQNWSSLRETIDLVAIKAIMLKPYFRRLWVVQETVLSDDTLLCCNKWKIPMKIFGTAAIWLSFGPSSFKDELDKDSQLDYAISFLEVVRIVSLTNPKELSLGDILMKGRMLQCSEPRDRVFGLSGILRRSTKKCQISVHAPDYTKSIVDVYCDATRACVGDCNRPWLLDEFGYDRSSDNTLKDLPTWVPNWYCGNERNERGPQFPSAWLRARMPRKRTKLWIFKSCDGEHCKRDAPFVPETSVGRILSIRGVVLETISKHSDTLNWSDIHEIAELVAIEVLLLSGVTIPTRERHDRLKHILGVWSPVPNFLQRWVKFLQSYSEGKNHTDNSLRPSANATELSRLDDAQNHEPEDNPVKVLRKMIREAVECCEEALDCCYSRKIIVTQSGLIGVGPEILQGGDFIAVSKLSQWPMVLRRAEEFGPDHYTVIGQAFIEGEWVGEDIFAEAAKRNAIETIHLV